MKTDRRPLGQKDADRKMEKWLPGVDGHTADMEDGKKKKEEEKKATQTEKNDEM